MATNAKSPLKDRPLRNPGQSLDEQIRDLLDDKVFGHLWYAGGLTIVALTEWVGYLAHIPRSPWLYSSVAAAAIGWAVWRILPLKRRIKNLKLGRDGERVFGQFLEKLREDGAQVFHDIPGDEFNLDHVVISPHGIFAIETKTISKSHPKSKVTIRGDSVFAGEIELDRNPIVQARAQVTWLSRMLEESTGRSFPVKGVVVFPGWLVEWPTPDAQRDVWVLSGRELPAFIRRELIQMKPDEVSLAGFHLSRFIRTAPQSV
jgi:hypothetical protein